MDSIFTVGWTLFNLKDVVEAGRDGSVAYLRFSTPDITLEVYPTKRCVMVGPNSDGLFDEYQLCDEVYEEMMVLARMMPNTINQGS